MSYDWEKKETNPIHESCHCAWWVWCHLKSSLTLSLALSLLEPQQLIAVLLLSWPIKVKVRFPSCLAVFYSYVFAKVLFCCWPLWHLSTASAQQSAVNSTMIHTWRIELSKVDRMCNLQMGGRLTLSVSVKNESLSCFMTDILSERRQSCQLLWGTTCFI